MNVDELLGDGKYKESYRLEMAKWGENIRKEDYGYFCRAALEMYNGRNYFTLLLTFYMILYDNLF